MYNSKNNQFVATTQSAKLFLDDKICFSSARYMTWTFQCMIDVVKADGPSDW